VLGSLPLAARFLICHREWIRCGNPFTSELQAVFDKIMPPGVPRLELFTTLARVPRIFVRFRAGSLLDRGPVPLRHREIVIDGPARAAAAAMNGACMWLSLPIARH
jgi:hypothetical protein